VLCSEFDGWWMRLPIVHTPSVDALSAKNIPAAQEQSPQAASPEAPPVASHEEPCVICEGTIGESEDVRLCTRHSKDAQEHVAVAPASAPKGEQTPASMTAAQAELAKKHGTPEEFARACNDAADQLMATTAEANAAILKYQQEWNAAGAPVAASEATPETPSAQPPAEDSPTTNTEKKP
jgi:hypothetical protein